MKKQVNFKLIVMFIVIVVIALFVMLKIDLKQEFVINAGENNKKEATIDSGSWDTNKVTVYTDSNGEKVPVPKGYVVSGVSSENVVKTGLVIYEGTASVTSAPTSGSSVISSAQATRNQWVWVPVADASRIYSETNGVKNGKIYSYSSTGRTLSSNNTSEPAVLSTSDNEYYFSRNGFMGYRKDSFYQKLQVEYEETIKSIQKYGGFYIGRYETGNLSQKTPVVRKMNTNLGSQTWYTMYDKSQYLSSTVNTRTSMIYESLWYETLQWLVESGNKTYSQIGTSATGWGNYYDISLSYINTSGSTVTKSQNSGIAIPSGSSEYAKANNIYDMAGNIFEWTVGQRNTTVRTRIGGSFINYGGGIGSGRTAVYSESYGPTVSAGDMRNTCIYVYKIR